VSVSKRAASIHMARTSFFYKNWLNAVGR